MKCQVLFSLKNNKYNFRRSAKNLLSVFMVSKADINTYIQTGSISMRHAMYNLFGVGGGGVGGTYADSQDPHQPAHPCSQIRALAVRLHDMAMFTN